MNMGILTGGGDCQGELEGIYSNRYINEVFLWV